MKFIYEITIGYATITRSFIDDNGNPSSRPSCRSSLACLKHVLPKRKEKFIRIMVKTNREIFCLKKYVSILFYFFKKNEIAHKANKLVYHVVKSGDPVIGGWVGLARAVEAGVRIRC